MTGTREAFTNLYLVMGLAILYFDFALSVFSTVLVMILLTVLRMVHPGGEPRFYSGGSYLMFVWFRFVAAEGCGTEYCRGPRGK